MARRPKSTEELQIGAKALHYSIKMLQGCSRLLIVAKFQSALIEKIALEAFLLDTRELREFFYPSKQYDDDVLYMDFFYPPNGWTPPSMTPRLDEIGTRLNKRLAHLSYSRETLDAEWNCAEIYNDLGIVINQFMKKVDRKKLIPEFDELFPMVDGKLLPSAASTASHQSLKDVIIGEDYHTD